ncbi:potassium channel family protein [Micromonospora sediminimaris]|uniref:Membrane protein n=1 Tax=Micromonospora sediminimaris TaxID=547162 RepID=A0A9W5XN50_9ACTN|nr:potassium channel family protein [Micromonospora sediminimaris]GIJ36213.1 membrane protein [Micromonospora sediminimaris]SFC52125.1 Ion channel [Micromonospora sediminimaris]
MKQKADHRLTRRRTSLACGLLFVTYFVVPVESDPDPTRLGLRIALTLLILGVVARLVTGQVRRQIVAATHARAAPPVTHLVLALIAGLLAFALADYVIARLAPAQFVNLETRVDALYFALATLTTIGYGDVHANGQFARVLVCAQMVFSIGVIATGFSLVVKRLTARV